MPKDYIFIFGGAIGDALLGVHLGTVLAAARPGDRLTLISTKASAFTRQLAALVPHVSYREMPKQSISSWLMLAQLALRPHCVAYMTPFRDEIPLWWRLIARTATLVGGREVHAQMRGLSAPVRVHIVRYDCKTNNLFEVIERVAEAWGLPTVHTQPSLPRPLCAPRGGKPYVLFHFFAGTYRRSWPQEKAVPLLRAARTALPGYRFVLTCAHPEESAARAIAEGIAETEVEVSPSAERLLCLLSQSSLVVGVASGVTHIGAHLHAPSVVLCNLSDPCWLPTYNKDVALLAAREHCWCRGDKTGECNIETPRGGVYRCLYDIKVEDVLSAMQTKLSPSSV